MGYSLAIKCHHPLSLVGEGENPCRSGRQDFRVKDGEVSLKLGSPQIFLLKHEIFQLLAGEKGETKAQGSSYRAQSKDLLTLFWGSGFSKSSHPSKEAPDGQGTPKTGRASQGHVPRTAVPLGGIILKSFGKWGQLT